MATSSFVFPQQCCNCLRPTTDVLAIGTSYSSSVLLDQTKVITTTYTLSVPYCARCVAGARRTTWLVVVGVLCFAILLWAVARFFLPVGVRIWVIVAAILLFIGALPIANEVTKPARVTRNGIPLFDNGEYQLLFEQASGLSPEQYEMGDRALRDINVDVALSKRNTTQASSGE